MTTSLCVPGIVRGREEVGCLPEQVDRHSRKRLGWVVAGAVVLQRKRVVKDRAAAADDRRVGEAGLPAQAAAVELAVELDHRVGRRRDRDALPRQQMLEL